MKIGDLVRCIASSARNQYRLGKAGIIVDVVTYSETYTSLGCKNYVVLTTHGRKYQCWKGDLEVLSESR